MSISRLVIEVLHCFSSNKIWSNSHHCIQPRHLVPRPFLLSHHSFQHSGTSAMYISNKQLQYQLYTFNPHCTKIVHVINRYKYMYRQFIRCLLVWVHVNWVIHTSSPSGTASFILLYSDWGTVTPACK